MVSREKKLPNLFLKTYTNIMKNVCGIDFGTSNSTVGVIKNGKFTMVPVEDDHTTIPSAIFYSADGAAPIYGRAAIEAYTEGDFGRLLRSLKSILGSSLINEKTGLGGQYISFEDVLVGFLKHLKDKAETSLGDNIDSVVMGRPVHFVDDNEAADKRAQDKLEEIARKAGFTSIEFQYEPIAAALSFENSLQQDEVVFIADIGGGTSDFSIICVGPSYKNKGNRSDDILANEGVHVGGTNLDTRLSLSSVMPLLGYNSKDKQGRELPNWPFFDLATWHRIHTLNDPKHRISFRSIMSDIEDRELFERYLKVLREYTGHMIARKVEDAKIELTTHATSVIDLKMVEAGLSATAHKPVFEQSVASELEKIELTIEKALKVAGISQKDITSVFLTGGTSVVPIVKHTLTKPFTEAKIVEGDRFNSVGFGLTLDAIRHFSE